MKTYTSHNGWHLYRVGEFHLDTNERELLRDGVPISITPKMFDVLWLLVQNRGHVVGKDELLETVWSDSFVQESNLTVTIRQLRKVLGDDAHNSTYIQTVARRGYRFVADVSEIPNEPKSDPYLGVTRSKPYVLISISAVLLLSLLGLAFVWSRGVRQNAAANGVTRLTSNGKITIAAFSPDGASIVFAQKEGGGESLWKRDLASGEEMRLLPPDQIEYVGLSVAPASDFAYYSIFKANAATSAMSRISLGGGSPEALTGIASDVSVSFSPDGRSFAFTEAHTAVSETHLKIANADGSRPRTLVTFKGNGRLFPTFRSAPIAWSPDGSEIACALKESEEGDSYSKIFLVNPNDGSGRYLSERRWGYVDNVAWRDPTTLAITEMESGTMWRRVWLVSTINDDVRRLTNDLNEYEWLSVARGKIYAVERNKSSSIYIADVTGDVASLQTKQIFNEPGPLDSIDWGRNDKIYFNSWSTGRNEIWQINTDGTGAKQVTHGSSLTEGFSVSPADGTIVFSAAPNRTDNLFIASPDGEDVRQLTNGSDEVRPRFTPDGKTVIFQHASLKSTLWRVSLETGESQQFTGFSAVHPSVSPDGDMIAYQFIDPSLGDGAWKLAITDSSDGRLLSKIDFPILITNRQVAWRPGDFLITMIANTGSGSGFLIVSPSENSHRLIDNVTSDQISSFVWSPDGRRLAFTAQRISSDVVQLGGQ